MKKNLVIFFSLFSCCIIHSQDKNDIEKSEQERLDRVANMVYVEIDSDSLKIENDRYTIDFTPLSIFRASEDFVYTVHAIGESHRRRGYRVDWEIIDSILYITNLQLTEFTDKAKKYQKWLAEVRPQYYTFTDVTLPLLTAKLEKLLGRKFTDGKIEADWFTGGLYAVDNEKTNVYFLKFREGKLFNMEKMEKKQIIDLPLIWRDKEPLYGM